MVDEVLTVIDHEFDVTSCSTGTEDDFILPSRSGKVYYVSENIYKDPDAQKAAESCDDLKQMKEIYQDAATLECDGLKSSLKLVEYATVDLDGTEKWYKKACEDFYKKVSEGAYD